MERMFETPAGNTHRRDNTQAAQALRVDRPRKAMSVMKMDVRLPPLH
ncbi:hypothetical protein RCO48_17565 [Peribacillus frigoritolerans]|nr:hypothetical protein [Peribacillus frigoritolerans]